MSLIVQKFGGTSVGSIERIRQVADKVARFRAEGHDIVVVVSAMSGETNRLIALANEISKSPNAREMGVLVSTGEQVTIALGVPTIWMGLLDALEKTRSNAERLKRTVVGGSALPTSMIPAFAE